MNLGPFYVRHWSNVLLAAQLLIGLLFIWHGPLYAADYPTYMRHAELIAKEEYNYDRIHGPNGLISHPGGHVLITSLFYHTFGIPKTTNDTSVLLGPRFIYLIIDLCLTKVIHMVYTEASPSTAPFDCILLLFTVRARNLFSNGLFTEPIAVLFCWLAVWHLLKNKPVSLTLVLFSIGVSIDASVLYFAPGLLYHLCHRLGIRQVALSSGLAFAWQLIAGLLFLLYNAKGYLAGAFTNRHVIWANSVTWKWANKNAFESVLFRRSLNAFYLFYLGLTVYLLRYRLNPRTLPKPGLIPDNLHISKFHTAVLIFSTALTGFVFSTTLLYQSWVFLLYSLPLLYRAARLPVPAAIGLHTILEYGYNGWAGQGASDVRSGALAGTSFLLLIGLVTLQFLLLRVFFDVDASDGQLEGAEQPADIEIPLD